MTIRQHPVMYKWVIDKRTGSDYGLVYPKLANVVCPVSLFDGVDFLNTYQKQSIRDLLRKKHV